jgi:hypothetical protein
MQDINRLLESGDIQDTVFAFFMDAYLAHAGTHGSHRLPIRRIASLLYTVDLITGFPTGLERESTQIVLCAVDKYDILT